MDQDRIYCMKSPGLYRAGYMDPSGIERAEIYYVITYMGILPRPGNTGL
jgi:hypothetical protein